MPCGGKAFLVGLHEGSLADGGAGLQMGQVGRPLAEVQLADAGADGPGADENHLPAPFPDAVELRRQRGDAPAVEHPLRVRQHVRADLHDDGARFAQQLRPHRVTPPGLAG